MRVLEGMCLAALLSFAAAQDFEQRWVKAPSMIFQSEFDLKRVNSKAKTEPVPDQVFKKSPVTSYPDTLEIFEGSECAGAPKTTCGAPDLAGFIDCPDIKGTTTHRVIDYANNVLVEYTHTKSKEEYATGISRDIGWARVTMSGLAGNSKFTKSQCITATKRMDHGVVTGTHTPLQLGTLAGLFAAQGRTPIWKEFGTVPNCGYDEAGYLTFLSYTRLECDTCVASQDGNRQAVSYKLSCDPTFANAPFGLRGECPSDYPIRAVMPPPELDADPDDWVVGAFLHDETYRYDGPSLIKVTLQGGSMCCKSDFLMLSFLFKHLIMESQLHLWQFGFDTPQERLLRGSFGKVPEKAEDHRLEVMPECIRDDPCTVKNAYRPDLFSVCREGDYATECYYNKTVPGKSGTDEVDWTPPADAVAPVCSDSDGAPNLGVTIALPVVVSLATAATIVYAKKKQEGG